MIREGLARCGWFEKSALLIVSSVSPKSVVMPMMAFKGRADFIWLVLARNSDLCAVASLTAFG